MMINSMDAALDFIFKTRRRLDGRPRGLDEYTRDIGLTRSLLQGSDLLSFPCQYAVVTGSRGKGSVTTIMAKLLKALGHRVGTITSPHLVHWNERIRVDGRMIPTVDFLRILNELQPTIDDITGALSESQYLSPQGIFLAIALRHFSEQGVNIAVLEVGRGGRFDDVAVVPNRLAVITPIMLEHTALLGATLGRIAWHKAGIIQEKRAVISAPQDERAMDILRSEALKQGAKMICLAEQELASAVSDRLSGQLIKLYPYGELFLPLLGRYQIANATLAIRAVELLQPCLGGDAPDSPAFKSVIARGLEQVKWLGRVQQLEKRPAIFVDGAITVASAESFVASVSERLRPPVVSIVGVPRDRDYAGVYRVMAAVSDALIISETDINPNTRFPSGEDALAAAREWAADVSYTDNLPMALSMARRQAGDSGTILLAVSLMLVGECMLIWDVNTSTI
jgi:dihydrofolate synthase/folylpolyglutamate synthase